MLMTVSDLHQINEFSSLSLGNSYTELVTSVHWRLRSSTELAICFQSSSSSPSSLAPKRTSSWRTGFLAVEKKELHVLYNSLFTIFEIYHTRRTTLYMYFVSKTKNIWILYNAPENLHNGTLSLCSISTCRTANMFWNRGVIFLSSPPLGPGSQKEKTTCFSVMLLFTIISSVGSRFCSSSHLWIPLETNHLLLLSFFPLS